MVLLLQSSSLSPTKTSYVSGWVVECIYSFFCIFNFQIHLSYCPLYELPSDSRPPHPLSSGEAGRVTVHIPALCATGAQEGRAAAELSGFLFPVKHVISYQLSFTETIYLWVYFYRTEAQIPAV